MTTHALNMANNPDNWVSIAEHETAIEHYEKELDKLETLCDGQIKLINTMKERIAELERYKKHYQRMFSAAATKEGSF